MLLMHFTRHIFKPQQLWSLYTSELTWQLFFLRLMIPVKNRRELTSPKFFVLNEFYMKYPALRMWEISEWKWQSMKMLEGRENTFISPLNTFKWSWVLFLSLGFWSFLEEKGSFGGKPRPLFLSEAEYLLY